MNKPEIIICRDVDELNRNAAAQWIESANGAIARAGRFAVALSGGSTPKALYSLLASPAYRDRIDWSRSHLFWGDERCVPPDHPESNFRMVREALLAKIQIPGQNIHRMAGEKEPSEAAADYEGELRNFFALGPGRLPRIDLILLGLGEDGHTASLFPGTTALNEPDRLVAAPYVEKFKAHRLTLTLPVINDAMQVTFLVAGESKSTIVAEILGSRTHSPTYPAAKVRPADGRLTWLIAADASARLPA
ncbi:MAG: 6-phosphogluconolactonase [Chloroflexota bacterium]